MTIPGRVKGRRRPVIERGRRTLRTARAKDGCRTVYFGSGENCDYRCVDVRTQDGYPAFTAVHGKKRVPVRLGIMGRHNVLNALVALAVADLSGLPMEDAAEKLEEFHGLPEPPADL